MQTEKMNILFTFFELCVKMITVFFQYVVAAVKYYYLQRHTPPSHNLKILITNFSNIYTNINFLIDYPCSQATKLVKHLITIPVESGRPTLEYKIKYGGE